MMQLNSVQHQRNFPLLYLKEKLYINKDFACNWLADRKLTLDRGKILQRHL